MLDKQHEVRFLPMFERDLEGIVRYISVALENPQAAEDLVDAIEVAIAKRAYHPTAFRPLATTKVREHEYYRLRVKNYAIFYVMVGEVMEVRRVLYGRRDTETLL